MAWLLDSSEDVPLVKKIERILGPLLQIVAFTEMIIPDIEDGVQSESDCEDDIVDQIVWNAYNKINK